jgi:hypothetical protein
MRFRIAPRLAAVTAAVMGTWLGFTAPTQAALASPASTAYVVGGTVLGVTIGQTPLSTFPPGGPQTVNSISIGAVTSNSVATADAEGSVAAGTSSASATVDQLGVNLGLLGTLGFTGVNSTCNAPAAPGTPTGSGLIAGATLTTALNGTTTITIPPGTNQTVGVSGVASIVFNKQTLDPTTNVLTVIAAEVTLLSNNNVLDIGFAQCGGAPAQAPTPMMYPPAAAGGLTVAAVMGFVYLRRRHNGVAEVEV